MSVVAQLIPEASTPTLWRQRLTDDQRWLLKLLAEMRYSQWYQPRNPASQRMPLAALVTEGLATVERRGGFKVYQATFLGRRVHAMAPWEPPVKAVE